MAEAGGRARVRSMGPRAILCALCLAALLGACAAPAPETRRSSAFSSVIALTLDDHAGDAAFEACFARLREIDAALNMWSPDSELSRLNARAGQGPVKVSSDLLVVALRGLELARQTGGIFDPTVGPLVRLWGIGSDHPRIPTEAEIARARGFVDWRRLRIDGRASTVELDPGMALDFGALAKGYGAMEGARLLAARGVRSGLLDVGGCVVGIGSGPGREAWRIGVQDPAAPRGRALGYFSLRDSGVDTSGIYERFFESGGRRYPHIMDTRTGRPVDGSVVSATVALPREENSDGPPLAFLVLGVGAGIDLADELGIPAVLITSDKGIYLSKAARPLFVLLDPSYLLIPTDKR